MNGRKLYPSLTRRRKTWRVVVGVLGMLLLIRMVLPIVLLRVVNDRLANISGYYGHIADLDLALIRGAYSIQEFQLDQLDTVTQARTPFLAAANIDLSVEWRALFKGRMVGEVV